MKGLLLFMTIHRFLSPVRSVNGVIWDKKGENFVPIFNDPSYAAVNQKMLSQSRGEETYNFQGKIVRFTYFEETNIVNKEANGTKVSGAIGEIWNTLSEFLNFTLKPIHSKENTLGYLETGTAYSNGLLRVIHENKTDVIPRVEAHTSRMLAAHFTIPLWQTSYRLYIRRESTHLPNWMLKLFSQRVWYAILVTYFLFTSCSYLSQLISSKFMRKQTTVLLMDHIFYNFGMICGQGYLPSGVCKSSRMVELWLGLFSCLIRTAFGALLIRYMTQTTVTPPFEDMQTLLDKTSYNIITLRGSLPDLIFQLKLAPEYKEAVETNRHFIAETMDEMYQTTCATNKLFAIYESEDVKKAKGMYICRLNPVGSATFDMFIVSGISWDFRYKRSIDIGILKLYEVGYINLLKHRWIETKNAEESKPNLSEPIVMIQVYFIILIFTVGLCISFIILLCENLAFYFID